MAYNTPISKKKKSESILTYIFKYINNKRRERNLLNRIRKHHFATPVLILGFGQTSPVDIKSLDDRILPTAYLLIIKRLLKHFFPFFVKETGRYQVGQVIDVNINNGAD